MKSFTLHVALQNLKSLGEYSYNKLEYTYFKIAIIGMAASEV